RVILSENRYPLFGITRYGRDRRQAWARLPALLAACDVSQNVAHQGADLLQGANRTGRPFTGDYAGVLLYETLHKFGFARGEYGAHPDDGLELIDCRITNAVRCVPPANKPTPEEIRTCRDFLTPTIAEMKKLRAVVVLGRIAHESTVRALGAKLSDVAFRHGSRHQLGELRLFSS